MYLVDVSKRTATLRLTVPNDDFKRPAQDALATPFGERLMTFFKAPVWTVTPKPEGGWTAKVYDLRFTSLVLPRPNHFEYEFDVPAKGPAKPRGVKIW